jgi:hypothetical protein
MLTVFILIGPLGDLTLINPSSSNGSSFVDLITGKIFGQPPTPRFGAGFVPVGQSIYVFGGAQSPGEFQFCFFRVKTMF